MRPQQGLGLRWFRYSLGLWGVWKGGSVGSRYEYIATMHTCVEKLYVNGPAPVNFIISCHSSSIMSSTEAAQPGRVFRIHQVHRV